MAIRIRNCTKEDLELMSIEEGLKPNFERYLELFGEYAGTIEDELGVIFCCGLNFFWGFNKGVGEVWIKVINKRKLFTIVRIGRRLLYEYAEKLKLWRIQATIRADDKQTLKLTKFMGFEEEARLTEFYPDKMTAIVLKLNLEKR